MPNLLKWWLEPPSRLKLPTAPAFEPLAVTSAEQVLSAFHELNARMDGQLKRGYGLALETAMITSPFSEAVKYNVYSAFVLIAAHNRRHLWQATQALKAVLVQPEMESWRFPLASIPPFGRG